MWYLSKNLDKIIKVPIKQLNWEVLPKGPVPAKNYIKKINPLLNTIPET